MRRLIVPLAIAALVLATSSTTVRADTIVEQLIELVDAKMDVTVQGTGNADYFVDLSKVNPAFFSGNYAVLDSRITYDLSAVRNPQCPPNITLRRSDAQKTSGDYVRRSAAANVGVQRVAIAKPNERYYLLQVRRDGTGVATSGACVTLANLAVPYTLRIQLYASAAKSTGLGFSSAHLPTSGDGEPTLAIDRAHGDAMYVVAPVGGPAVLGGMPSGTDMWRSFDHGASWTYSQPVFGLNSTAGFDNHVVVDGSGAVLIADLAATTITVGKSIDRGASFQFGSAGGNDADRQWLAVYTPPGATTSTKYFLDYHDINVDNLPYECIGSNGGTEWELFCHPMTTNAIVAANAFGNTFNGNQVFDSAGVVNAVFASPALGDPNATTRNLYLARSSDGIVWTNQLAYQAPIGFDIGGLFPVIAVDAADDLFVTFSERQAPFGPSVIKLVSSSDHGVTWSKAVSVSTAGQSAVLPWITAGKRGQVDIVWAATTKASTNDPTADWYMYMAQSQTALAGTGFRTVRMTPQPIRYGTVCLSGIGCSTSFDDGRILLDFTSIDYDTACRAYVAYANSGPEGPADAPSRTYTDVARQTSGSTVCQ
jgi:hypothetical protein